MVISSLHGQFLSGQTDQPHLHVFWLTVKSVWQLLQTVYNSFPYTFLSVFVIHYLDDWLEAFPNSHLLTRQGTSHQLRSMATLRFPTKSSPLRRVDLGNMSYYSSQGTCIIEHSSHHNSMLSAETIVSGLPLWKLCPHIDQPYLYISISTAEAMQVFIPSSSLLLLALVWVLIVLCKLSWGCEQFLHSR